jgi:hypothetical protein
MASRWSENAASQSALADDRTFRTDGSMKAGA